MAYLVAFVQALEVCYNFDVALKVVEEVEGRYMTDVVVVVVVVEEIETVHKPGAVVREAEEQSMTDVSVVMAVVVGETELTAAAAVVVVVVVFAAGVFEHIISDLKMLQKHQVVKMKKRMAYLES